MRLFGYNIGKKKIVRIKQSEKMHSQKYFWLCD